jgi:hypothetical protein
LILIEILAYTSSVRGGKKAGKEEASMEPIKRRRSDRLAPKDQLLKEKLVRAPWTRAELEWLERTDPRLPLILASIINGKLRALEEMPTL